MLGAARDVLARGRRAVAAENQALRLLADLAGLPAGAGGCFVSGGSLGNLSALVVARDTAAARGVGTPQGRPLVAVSEEAHSSIAGPSTSSGPMRSWSPRWTTA